MTTFRLITSSLCLSVAVFFPPCHTLAQTPGKRRSPAASAALKPNQPEAPAGFNIARPGMARGKVVPFEYPSASDGGAFRATLYLPPVYVNGKKYPVLYLLHGASGDENTWVRDMNADAILDNLYADKKLAPMLVVMPSSLSVAARAEAGESRDSKVRAGMAFGEVLVRDLIPFVEAKYPALTGRDQRALAGLSMGAGTALSTGLARSDTFAWIGAFSGAGRRWAEPREKLRLLWLSVGDQDSMMSSGMIAAHVFFREKNVPHEFRINFGSHEPKVWMNDLYHFAPLLFR